MVVDGRTGGHRRDHLRSFEGALLGLVENRRLLILGWVSLEGVLGDWESGVGRGSVLRTGFGKKVNHLRLD